jgi:hypothetical protein
MEKSVGGKLVRTFPSHIGDVFFSDAGYTCPIYDCPSGGIYTLMVFLLDVIQIDRDVQNQDSGIRIEMFLRQ